MINEQWMKENWTVAQWGMWLRYAEQNNIGPEAGVIGGPIYWPEYEVHEFEKILKLLEDPSDTLQMELKLEEIVKEKHGEVQQGAKEGPVGGLPDEEGVRACFGPPAEHQDGAGGSGEPLREQGAS